MALPSPFARPCRPWRAWPTTTRAAVCASIVGFLGSVLAGPVRAQQAEVVGDTVPRWRGSAAAEGFLLFGAARQRLVSGTLAASRAAEAMQLRAELAGSYGESTAPDDERTLSARNARLFVGADRQPRARVSPFAFGIAETSLQQAIRWRYTAGAGAKYVAWRGRADEEASVSLALLSEVTRPLTRAGVGPAPTLERHRASLRVRWRRQLGPLLRVNHVTFYQPTLGALARYTVESTTTLASPVRAGLDLTATLQDRYDSEARTRGARSNHDGQLRAGVRARF